MLTGVKFQAQPTEELKLIKDTGTVLDGNLLKSSTGRGEGIRRPKRSKGRNLNEASKKIKSDASDLRNQTL